MKLEEQIQTQRDFFATGATKSLKFRLTALKNLLGVIKNHEKEITKALWDDLKKSEFEAYATEIGITENEIKYTINNLKKWAKTRCKPTPMALFPSRSRIVKEPFGVALIIAPWNYPFQLVIMPLIGAIAAGNCAIVKPSTAAQATANVLEKIIKTAFDEKYVMVVNGANQLTDQLLEEQMDYIFYTGGVGYGKYVAAAAAKHLTPTTLELGGKSPCVVDEDANVPIAARRIIWGKMLNAGQTCVAPDYVMVHKNVAKNLTECMAAEIERQFGKEPKISPDYARIINDAQFVRLTRLLDSSANVICGGENDATERYIAPTLIAQPDMNSELMKDEIFGPLLPIVVVDHIQEAITYIAENEKPLALYYFTQSKKKARQMIENTRSGGVCINDVVIHAGSSFLPFGGVGSSGMGTYHGKASFDTFSHVRAVMSTITAINANARFAPYKDRIKLLKRLM